MRHEARRRALSRIVLFSCWLVAVLFGASARAEMPRNPAAHGIAAVHLHDGTDVVVLTPRDGALVGMFTIENRGSAPLAISRVAVRGDDDDVRAPASLSAHLEGEGVVPPAGTRNVIVQWALEGPKKPRQALAHVVVTTGDEAAGEIAVGVRGHVPSAAPWLFEHVLSWLLALPLAVMALALAALAFGNKDDRLVAGAARTAAAIQCALALWMYTQFDGELTRIDGNDGYQFVERLVWIRSIAAEYFVGVDGVSMAMVLVTCLLGLVGLLTVRSATSGFFVAFLALVSGLIGVFVALDLALMSVFLGTVAISAYAVTMFGESEASREAGLAVLLPAVFGVAFVLTGAALLYANGERTFLVDGTPVSHSFAIPELMRMAFRAKAAVVLGLPLAKVAWLCFFAGFAVFTPIFPLHLWLPKTVEAAPPAAAMVLVGLVPKIGVFGMMRVCFGVLPEASRWASGAVVALGAVSVVYGALSATGQTSLRRMIAYGTMSQMGFCLVGLGSLTPQGIAACAFHMASTGIASAMLLVLVDALEARVMTSDTRALGGLGKEAPVFAALLAFAVLAAAGVPGLVGFWGEFLALVGAFPLHGALAVCAALGVALTARYHVRTLHQLLAGALPSAVRTSAALAPFGGRVLDVSAREAVPLLPLVVIAAVLGVWPGPLFSLLSGGVRDITTLVNPPGADQIALIWP